MRMKKLIATTLTATVLSASGSFAQSSDVSNDVLATVQIIIDAPGIADLQAVQDLVEELKADGFLHIEIRRTFLGRARIVAYSATEIREIIINPTTSEVLRDLAQSNSDSVPGRGKGLSGVASEQGNNKGGLGNGNGGNSGGGGGN